MGHASIKPRVTPITSMWRVDDADGLLDKHIATTRYPGRRAVPASTAPADEPLPLDTPTGRQRRARSRRVGAQPPQTRRTGRDAGPRAQHYFSHPNADRLLTGRLGGHPKPAISGQLKTGHFV